jgi:oligo-1,6-glucosidase
MLQLKQSLARWQDGLAEVGWNSLYLGNHGQPRCVSRFGSDAPEHREQSAKALATVLHLHRGTPYVYQGDELGMSNAGFTRLDQLRDVESLNHYATAVARGEDPADVIRALAYKGRDNARVPISWDASPGAGFTTGTPWLDLHPLSGSVNAAAQVDDPDSVFSHYRRLIALRHSEPCVAHGTFRMLLADHELLYCFERSFGDTRLLIAANLSSAAEVVPDLSELAAWSSAEPLIASVPGSTPAPTDPLAPWESRVFGLT